MDQKTVIIDSVERASHGFLNINKYVLRHTTPDGGMSRPVTREVMTRGNAAAVLIYDPQKDAVLLIEEFRIGNLAAGFRHEDCWSLGPVAGGIENDESGLSCVIREAREEAGIELNAYGVFGPLQHFSSPGGTSEILEIFVAKADISTADPALMANDADEHTQPVIMSRADLNAMIYRDICPASLVSAVLLLDKVFPQENTLPDVDTLSNIIRMVDGQHKLGAGALAEAILNYINARGA